MPNVNILSKLDKYVKDELEKNVIPKDAKYVIVGTVDNNGGKILASVNINQTEKVTTRVMAVWEHDWEGDDTVAAKLIFVGK